MYRRISLVQSRATEMVIECLGHSSSGLGVW
jgi:hypothetical protein